MSKNRMLEDYSKAEIKMILDSTSIGANFDKRYKLKQEWARAALRALESADTVDNDDTDSVAANQVLVGIYIGLDKAMGYVFPEDTDYQKVREEVDIEVVDDVQ